MFCDNPSCQADPRILAVHEIAQNVTGLPLGMQEFMQVVKYNIGQFYMRHPDTSSTYGRSANGHRIYTLFLYLKDVLPEHGGETSFPEIGGPGGLQVKPK